MGSCSSPGELNLINKLRPVTFNFVKDLDVSTKIVKSSCNVSSNIELLMNDRFAPTHW